MAINKLEIRGGDLQIKRVKLKKSPEDLKTRINLEHELANIYQYTIILGFAVTERCAKDSTHLEED